MKPFEYEGYDMDNTGVRTEPYVEIENQPQQRIRFRYRTEGSTAGTIYARGHTGKDNAFPSIKVHNYEGPFHVLASCVTSTEPHLAHPHQLVSSKNCARGVYQATLKHNRLPIQFPNLGIQHCKRADIKESLKERKELNVDPFNLGFDHMRQRKENKENSLDLKTVRLCFQVFLPDALGQYTRPLKAVVSDPIYDSKAAQDLKIVQISHTEGSVEGGQQVTMLVDKVNRDDIEVYVYEEDAAGHRKWDAFGNISMVHHQVAIVFSMPEYASQRITGKQRVRIVLKKQSSGATSEPVDFFYLPREEELSEIPVKKRKMATEKVHEMISNGAPSPSSGRNMTNATKPPVTAYQKTAYTSTVPAQPNNPMIQMQAIQGQGHATTSANLPTLTLTSAGSHHQQPGVITQWPQPASQQQAVSSSTIDFQALEFKSTASLQTSATNRAPFTSFPNQLPPATMAVTAGAGLKLPPVTTALTARAGLKLPPATMAGTSGAGLMLPPATMALTAGAGLKLPPATMASTSGAGPMGDSIAAKGQKTMQRGMPWALVPPMSVQTSQGRNGSASGVNQVVSVTSENNHSHAMGLKHQAVAKIANPIQTKSISETAQLNEVSASDDTAVTCVEFTVPEREKASPVSTAVNQMDISSSQTDAHTHASMDQSSGVSQDMQGNVFTVVDSNECNFPFPNTKEGKELLAAIMQQAGMAVLDPATITDGAIINLPGLEFQTETVESGQENKQNESTSEGPVTDAVTALGHTKPLAVVNPGSEAHPQIHGEVIQAPVAENTTVCGDTDSAEISFGLTSTELWKFNSYASRDLGNYSLNFSQLDKVEATN